MNKEEMLEELQEFTWKDKLLKKIGLVPKREIHNLRVLLKFSFSNIQGFMKEQMHVNDDVFEILEMFNEREDEYDRGMVQ